MVKSARAAAKPPKPGSLRSRLHDATQRVIVDAMVEQLADTGAFDFSMFELARRANVSARTIYRHFPTRAVLFEALSARVNEELGWPEAPRTLDEAIELVRALFAKFDAHAPFVVAELETQRSRKRPQDSGHGRTAALQRAVAESAPRASAETRRRCAAAIACLVSSDAWARLHYEQNLDARESAEAVVWALDAFKCKLAVEKCKPGAEPKKTRRR
jgi:AcrR family transcriptional regulator